MRHRVLVTDYAWPSLSIERELLARSDAELVVAPTGSADELVDLARDADAILTNWKPVPPAALDGAERCLVVSRYGVGVDNIPVARATELGILVVNVPDFCVDEVSDHAMALLLACARRVVMFACSTGRGEWDLAAARGLPRLRGQVLGLVGFGQIARALVPKAQAFGLEVHAYTPRIEPGPRAEGVIATNELAPMLAAADYVSVHAPASAETAGLIGEAELRTMKETAYLINTSRGSLVDEEALRRALDEGWIAGAALDVLGSEPPPAGHAIPSHARAVVTPHVAFYSDAAIAELELRAATNVAEVLAGRLPASVVNPAVVDRANFRLAARESGSGSS
jgi:D-3-phosphoglycerate dehydrogenase